MVRPTAIRELSQGVAWELHASQDFQANDALVRVLILDHVIKQYLQMTNLSVET